MSRSNKPNSIPQGVPNSIRGIGLLEVLVALALFSFGIIFAMRTLPASNSTTSQSRNVTKATNLAQAKLEELTSLSYTDTELNAGAHNDPTNPIEKHFTRTWDISDDDPIQGMKRIDVRVTYETANADSSVTLNTFITSRR